MELVDLEKLIKSRRSIRRWQDKKVPEELLLRAIELATWAPNAGNQQNWHFYVILNHSTIKAMADAVQAAVDRMASWPAAAKFSGAFPGTGRRPSFFDTAPAAIAVGTARYQSIRDQLLESREKSDSQAAQMRQWLNVTDTRIQSVASAIAYLLLVLHQMGLGAVWMAGPMQAKDEIEKILKVPPGIDIIAFIPVGYPDEQPPSGGRKPVSEVSEVIR